MYCFLSEVFAVSIIIFMLIRRFTASIKTSNSSAEWSRNQGVVDRGHKEFGAPRHLRGHPIDSHKERSRQMVEKDFSPPLRERGSLSFAPCV